MHRGSAITAGLLIAGLGLFGLSHEAAGQAGSGMVMLTDGTSLNNFDQAGNANWRIAERTIAADRGKEFAWIVGGVKEGPALWRYRFMPVDDGTEVQESSALIRLTGPFAEMPDSAAMRPMSTSAEGRASRRLSIGTKLCPPASTFASSPSSASTATASSTDSTTR